MVGDWALVYFSDSFISLKKESWPLIAIAAALLSQILIAGSWKDAKFGTIANAIILFGTIAGLTNQLFESQFRKSVQANLQQTATITNALLTGTDIQYLPQPVQKYLKYAGALDRPRIKNMRIVFKGEMRGKGKNWFGFQSVQYNFFDEPARFFFMKARMFGTVVPGYPLISNSNRYNAREAVWIVPRYAGQGWGNE